MGKETAKIQAGKRAYSSPRLTTYGDFRKLTLGSQSTAKTDTLNGSGRKTKTGAA